MRYLRLLILLLFAVSINAQTVKFAVVTDLNYSGSSSAPLIDSLVNLINNQPGIEFTIFHGNLTEDGTTKEFSALKRQLKKLKQPFHIVPGDNDIKKNETGRLAFASAFETDHFSFTQNNDLFIGINTTAIRSGINHLSPEELKNLSDDVDKLKSGQKLFVFLSQDPFENTDNWFKAINVLSGHQVRLIAYPAKKKSAITKKDKINYLLSRQTIDYQKNKIELNLVEDKGDTVLFYPASDGSAKKVIAVLPADSTIITKIDSSQFINYSADLLWKNDLNATLPFSPLTWKGFVITTDYNGIITCVDSTGEKVWDYDTFANIISRPVISDSTLIVATLQGDLITINAATGSQMQSIGFDEPITSELIVIDYTGDKELMMPKYSNSKAAVIIGTASGKLHCYDLETLQEYWANSSAKKMIEGRPLYINNKILFTSRDGIIYCIDAREGWLIWGWKESKDADYKVSESTPVSDGKNVYVAASNGTIFALDLLLGKLVWNSDKYNNLQSMGMSTDGSTLLIKSAKDKFYLVSTDKGKRIKEIDLRNGYDTISNIPVEYNGSYLVSCQNGCVYLINKNLTAQKLLFLGNAPVLSVQDAGDGKFVISNIDGQIAEIKLN